MLYGLARFCVRQRFLVVGIWVVITVGIVGYSHTLGNDANNNLSLPGTDSQRATDTLSQSFPDQANGSSPIVLHAKSGKITDSKYADGINQSAKNLCNNPNVGAVVSPLSSEGAGQVSKDQTIGYFSVSLSKKAGELPLSDAEGIVDDANPAQAAGLQVETGGQLGQQVSKT